MFIKTISYVDYDGVERTENFYFNLSKAEMIMLESTTPGGYTAMLQRIVDSKDNVALMNAFTDLIKRSYGIKSEDGKRFIKNDQVVEDFLNSAAYEQMFLELFTTENAAIEFVRGIMPHDINRQLAFADTNK